MSNLVPALVSVPVFVLAITFYIVGYHELAMICFIVFPLVGWLSINWFGLFQNHCMKNELRSRLKHERITLPESTIFVGFAGPNHTSLLDAHEDVGFICITDKGVDFYGDTQRHGLDRNEIIGINLRANAHTLLGMGRWISIEGKRNGVPIRMMIEPREKKTLWQNRQLGTYLIKQLRKWLKGQPISFDQR
jgi:hypothetical protein